VLIIQKVIHCSDGLSIAFAMGASCVMSIPWGCEVVGRGAVAWWLKEELEAIRHVVFLPQIT
jgi:hypothetical protein